MDDFEVLGVAVYFLPEQHQQIVDVGHISSQKIPTSYWQTTIPAIKSYKADKTITFLGEADIASDATRLKTVGFDYDYAWQFQSSLANYATGTASSRLKAFVNTLLEKSAGLTFGRMLYVTNHDQNWNEQKKTLTQKYGHSLGATYYDLSGRRVAVPTHAGIYIRNGKKLVVRK